MKKLFVALSVFAASQNAVGYETGSAPFCAMDNVGNLECYYYTMSSCLQAIRIKYGTWSCVRR